MTSADSLRLGVDLGAANVKLLLRAEQQPTPLFAACRPAQGRPLATLLAMLEELPCDREAPLAVAVTGGGLGLLEEGADHQRVNELAAAARGVHRDHPEVRTVIDMGAQSSKWILLGAGDDGQPDGGVQDFATNGLCAAGSGAFLEQQSSRLHLDLEELGELARSAARGAPIAGRCSVFAKSDMIHLQQKGTPPEEIAYGLCQALVRTFLGTVLQGRRLRMPLVLIGGGAANPGIVRAFREELDLADGDPRLTVPADPFGFAASGAADMIDSAKLDSVESLAERLRQRLQDSARAVRDGGSGLLPLGGTQLDDDQSGRDHVPADGPVEAFLGIDVGSVSTNLVLIDRASRVLQRIYLPTRGQPVAVLDEGLSQLHQRWNERLRILGVGTTGSGRHLAARLIGGDVVRNEITAQMASSVHFVPEVDTVFEIGGQDSKFISVRDGHLADFEMNKICAAGTGSFLEEQAERLDVKIVGEFGERALQGEQPHDLGTRCTVFMDAELVRAQANGASVEDLCAGLAYSVARNYLEKVVASRPLGEVVIFQGGTASNQAVVAAFRQLLGRRVVVHPFNRVSGAIGVALLAARELAEQPYDTVFHGFASCAEPTIRSFECKACDNRCRVNRIKVGDRVVHFGDACEMYSDKDREEIPTERPFQELFGRRAELFNEEAVRAARGEEAEGRPRMGLVRATLNQQYLPLWVTLLRELGFEPVIGADSTDTVMRQQPISLPSELCAPLKAAEAHARALLASGEVERLFMPMLLEHPPSTGDRESYSCLFTQAFGEMLHTELGDPILSCKFTLTGDGRLNLSEPVSMLARALQRPKREVRRALRRAGQAQKDFAEACFAEGTRALDAPFDRAVVVFGRPYNLHDPALNVALARHLERLGLPAIPLDMLRLDEVELDERWETIPWHYNRQQLRALELMRRDGRLFPIMVSSYGCGPDGFTTKHLERMLAGRPRLLLEFDEHRGEAGLVTRIEAFADEIDTWVRGTAPKPELGPPTRGRPAPDGRKFWIPDFGYPAPLYAGMLRGAGREAEVLPPGDEETLRRGEQLANGRECHPWTLMAGEIMRCVESGTARPGDVILCLDMVSACLLRQYGDGYRILLDQAGYEDIALWETNSLGLRELCGLRGSVRLWEAVYSGDTLYTLAARLRPYESEPGSIDQLFDAGILRIADALAEGRSIGSATGAVASELMAVPRDGEPGQRPLVGVTGDMYTRMHPTGNANLFQRLEELGCEVWASPYWADTVGLSCLYGCEHAASKGQFRLAFFERLSQTLTDHGRRHVIRRLPPRVRELAVEPHPSEVMRGALPYLGERTNFLIVNSVGKLVDFLQRGATGVVNTWGLNCMVGVTSSAFVQAVRDDFDQAPIVNLVYGGNEGPSQRIRLETFVHQVHERWRAQQAVTAAKR